MKVDLEKVRALAKSSHNPCLGTGIVRGTNMICRCVVRALARRGFWTDAEIEKQLAPDPPATPETTPAAGEAVGS